MTKAWVAYGAGETLDLDSYTDPDGGIQVVRGLTGAGLPGITSQWAEGVGDGATFRNSRVLPREIDLPLEIAAPDRDTLRALVSQVSIAFAGQFTLWYEDDNGLDRWYIKGRRVGGGNPTLGVDTNGLTHAAMVISVKCGDPYWTRDTTVTENWDDLAIATPLTVNNPGTARVFPKWRLRGPMLGFSATGPDGDSFAYTDYIPDGKVIEIDCANGTVRQGSENRYQNMGPAPRLFPLPPGETDIDIQVDRSSADFVARRSAGRTNHVLNPATTSTTGWSGTGISLSSGRVKLATTAPGGTRKTATLTVSTGLSLAGVPLLFRARVYKETTQVTGDPAITIKSGSGSFSTTAWVGIAKASAVQGMAVGDYIDIEVPVVTDSTGNFDITFKQAWSATMKRGDAVSWTRVFLGESGGYFDGSFTDTAQFDYSWVGTANNSKSTEVEIAGLTQSQVQVTFSPKDWMVI